MVMDLVVPKRRLGRTEIEVTPIGLGVMQFSGSQGVWGFMFQDLPQEQMNAIVKAALDGGINWFDTAEMYGRGRSEQGLARALNAAGKSDEEVVIGTKWLPLFRTAANIPRTIDDRLRFLEGYSIGLYMVHQPWSFSAPEAEMEAMADLVAAGKIRSVGVSNFNVNQMRRAHAALAKHGLPLAVNQVQYSLLHRQIETDGLLQAARDLGVTIVAWGPLGSGILTGKYHKDPDILHRTPLARRLRLGRQIESSRPLVAALEEVAGRYGATPAQVALNWLVNFNGETVVAIPGASRVQHAEQSAGAMHFKLSDEDLQRLDRLSRPFTR
jgi:aryl-alcohol dehydrogenase-like predicted oxidoreductase